MSCETAGTWDYPLPTVHPQANGRLSTRRLRDNLPPVIHVVPDDEPVQVAAAREEDAAGR
jgi:hypothetical protein